MWQPALGAKATYLVEAVRRSMLDVLYGAAAVTPTLLPLRVLYKTNGVIHQYSWLASAFQWYRLRIDATRRNSWGSWNNPACLSRSATAA